MRLFSIIACLGFLVGCVDAPGGVSPPKKDTRPAITIEQLAFESFQKRDIVRAAKLRALKGTRFDAKRIDAIAEAGAEASRETWEPTAKALAVVLDKLPQDDQKKFDDVLEQLARASERAGCAK